MLPIYDISVSRATIRAMSDRVLEILQNLTSSFECDLDIQDVEFLLPEHLVVENPDLCLKKLKQFYSIVKDGFVRDYLDPIYEYILYQLLQYEISLLKEENRLPTISYDELFDEKGNLISKIPEEYFVEDISGYLDHMFLDCDFLTVSDGIMTSELIEYSKLMPEDIRERVSFEKSNNDNTKERILIESLKGAIKQIEERPTLYHNYTEPQINDSIESITRQYLATQGIIIHRERPYGFASTGSGEVDYYVEDVENSSPIAIGESKDARLFNKTLPQLLGYMNANNTFGFTININYDNNITKVKEYIIDKIKIFEKSDSFMVTEISLKGDVIISYHNIPEKIDKQITLVHLILNLNTKERQKIAKIARKSSKQQ